MWSGKLYVQHIFCYFYSRSPVSRNFLSDRKGFFFNVLLDKVCDITVSNLNEVNQEFIEFEDKVEQTIDQVEDKFEETVNSMGEKMNDHVEEKMDIIEDKVEEVVEEVKTTSYVVIGVVGFFVLLVIVVGVIAARNGTRITNYVQYLDTLKGKEFYVWCCRLFLPFISFGL